MKDLRLFTTSAACALGAAVLATTALQSTPAEARAHASGHTRASAHSVGHKVSSRVSQPLPGQHSQTSSGGGGSGGGGGGNESPQSKPHDGGRPVPPGGIPSGGTSIPTSGNDRPPPTSGIPTTGPINPGNLPGSNPTQTPNFPGTKQPPGPKPVPPPETNYPGNRPPILTGTPTRAPIPPVISGGGSSPGNRIGTTYGVYAEIGANGDGYAPCRWFKSNYDRTGNAYWLNRYKVCLWQH